ncbi:hypothetical protein [Streptomyces sp. NPDC000888]
MSDIQTHAEWQAEQHRIAQEAAVEWAVNAEAALQAALQSETYVKEHQDSQYLRTPVAEQRVNAQEHHARSTAARQLAEMWARVATALAPSHDAYDVHVGLDPAAARQALDAAAHSGKPPPVPSPQRVTDGQQPT